jgi:hypothetical protein
LAPHPTSTNPLRRKLLRVRERRDNSTDPDGDGGSKVGKRVNIGEQRAGFAIFLSGF